MCEVLKKSIELLFRQNTLGILKNAAFSKFLELPCIRFSPIDYESVYDRIVTSVFSSIEFSILKGSWLQMQKQTERQTAQLLDTRVFFIRRP